MDNDKKITRLSMSDKIHRFETQKPVEKQVLKQVEWSLSEALEIGASFLALEKEREIALATSQVDRLK